MILITGATGNVGSELITALLPDQAGHVRVLTRNPGAVFPDGTQKVVADLGDSDLAPVLDGVRAVFLLTDGLHIAAHDQRLGRGRSSNGRLTIRATRRLIITGAARTYPEVL
jgi:uncharacterized protein YbjT (DUF2867 family)